jgi:predicted nuclease of predicted toxin-antitoxin system
VGACQWLYDYNPRRRFFLLAQLRGQPPKVVCLRFGNRGVRDIAEQLQRQQLLIVDFITESEAPCLELYWGPFLR